MLFPQVGLVTPMLASQSKNLIPIHTSLFVARLLINANKIFLYIAQSRICYSFLSNKFISKTIAAIAIVYLFFFLCRLARNCFLRLC